MEKGVGLRRNGEGERGSAHDVTQAQDTHDAEQQHQHQQVSPTSSAPLFLLFYFPMLTPHTILSTIIINTTWSHLRPLLLSFFSSSTIPCVTPYIIFSDTINKVAISADFHCYFYKQSMHLIRNKQYCSNDPCSRPHIMGRHKNLTRRYIISQPYSHFKHDQTILSFMILSLHRTIKCSSHLPLLFFATLT